ncbi:hypothetical protein [Nocardia terpenica]|uniref:Uncharacterized protein n=1 Tax=Nocardia terpenica TaxID=455432 RepID=A0A291RNN6_9NOCA|nr:hypothetical protein [Nocardia terpenica]ATL69173.1 hypothetical protein CRH09_26330 [Nocardia terpenica]
MTSPGFNSWQNQNNAARQAMDALHRARRSTEDAARLSRGSSPSGCAPTLITLTVVAAAVVARTVAIDIIRHTSFDQQGKDR